ncbi:MAG TPA: ABC transporter substrate-binding protein, partial [Campylobacterales bacterium]|nr:ABC transporter substrate-binding protein [Campylobacterales bacterium]
MKRLKALILLLFFAAEVCGYDKDVTLQLKWKHQFQFAGYYAALEKGFYKEAGLNVKIDEWDSKINPIERVLSG